MPLRQYGDRQCHGVLIQIPIPALDSRHRSTVWPLNASWRQRSWPCQIFGTALEDRLAGPANVALSFARVKLPSQVEIVCAL